MNCTSNVFEHLGDAVFVIDEPGGIESYLSEFYERLSERFREIDQADDIALAPEELFLTAEELREFIRQRQRIELRTLGRAAAETDLNLSLEAEAPKVQLGRARGTRQPRLSVSRRSRARWKSNGSHNRRCAITAALPILRLK